MTLGQRLLSHKHELETTAAVAIQSAYRGKLGRREVLGLVGERENKEAADTLTRSWRCYSSRYKKE